MPSAINVNGVVTRRPGTYGRADASSLAGSVLDVNQVALCGEFPLIEHAVPLRINTPQQFKYIDTGNIDGLSTLAKFLWTPANDSKVPGGPNAVYLLNIQPNTQAQYTLKDAGLNASLVLKAQMWGPRGNKTRFAMSANSGDATLRDMVIEREGISETYRAMGSGKLATFYYDGTDMDIVTLAYTAGVLTIKQTKATIALGAFVPGDAAFDGVLTLGASVGPAAGETYTATINGINKSTGVPDIEVVTWDNASGVAPIAPPAKPWSMVSSIVFVESGSSAA